MKRNLSILLTALVCTTAINASAIEQDASGYYLVTTPEELCSVSSVVNAGNSNVKIRLVNDLDMSSITNFPSIGIFDWPSGPQVAFQGEFDGQGHIIYNLTIDNTSDAQETGLFGRVNGGGYIHDFGVVNANITANARAGVVAGEIHASTVDNVFTAGNLVVISNNTSQYCGLSGEGANSTFNNCYTTFNGPLTNIPERLNNCYWGQDAIDMAETGELCYKLNGDQQNIVWRQNLGEDKYPVQDKTHAQVYQKGQKDCGGNIIGAAEYTNEAQDDILPPHQYDETGICIVCGNDVGKTTIDDDGYMAISNPWQMRYFATYVNSGNYQAKARLTEDIDMSAIENFPMLGYFDWDNQGSGTQFGGEIDGQGHVIKNLRVTVDARVEAGFCSRAGGATFRNLGFENATITNTHADGVRAGVLGGELFVCNVINCWSFGDIQINTTYYQKGGFGGEAAGTNFTNCWTTYNAIGDSPNSVINTYWGQDVANMHASGELCYKLNGDQQNIVWRQNLGEDEYPVQDKTHAQVYQKGQKDCGGNIIGAAEYTNEAQDDILPPHQYDETGICIVCGNDVGKTTIDDDGYMAISNPWQMRYFATYVNSGNYQAKARLTEDIDMSAIENFPMLGYFDWDNQGSGTQFGGEIDGQGHVIKNLRVTVDARVEAGFCSRAGGATFRNLGFENATITNTHADGVRAGVLGGELFVCNVINCWSFGDIQINTTYYQKGGFGGEAAGTNFTNCWTTYNAIGDSPNSVINTYWGQDVANMHASGELCYKLNGDQQNIVWRQNLGEDEYPVLDSTHGIVKEITDAGYATMYLPETSVTIPAGVEAFTGIIAEDYLVMNPIESVVIKGQAVVLKGNEGYYSFIPTDAGVGLIQSDLIGTDEPLQANGSQYVLAEKDGVIGFYKAEGIIPAGKAYLLSSSGVKAFLFEFDDATGIANVEKAVENGAIYNLAGQRQNKIQKGINIVNGKKISK